MAKKNVMMDENLPATTEPMTPAAMLDRAITSGASVEVMERLLALQERFEANQARKKFDSAMAEVRKDLPEITKTKTAGRDGYGYKYEDLSEIVSALTPVLGKVGLSFRWRTETIAVNAVKVTCILSHRDGHSEETSLSSSSDTSGGKNAIQAIGSAVTYLQRYTLKAALGIAAGFDDDAGGASAPMQRKFSGGGTQEPQQQQSGEQSGGAAQPLADHQEQLRERLKKMIELQPAEMTNEFGGAAAAYKSALVHLSTWKNHPGTDNIRQFTKKMSEIALEKVNARIKELEASDPAGAQQ